MFGIRRSTEDPLWRAFLDKYNLNLLSIPRENVNVGDLYSYDKRRVEQLGNVKDLLEPPFDIPPDRVVKAEQMANLTGTMSSSHSVGIGFGLLEGFLSAMGAVGVIGSVEASYKAKGTKELRFRFTQVTRDSVSSLFLDLELNKYRVQESNLLSPDGHTYFLVTGVVRSPSISVIAEAEKGAVVDVDVKAIAGILSASSGVSVARSNKGELTYEGKILAIGVEVFELRYDVDHGTLSLRTTHVEPQMKMLTSYQEDNEETMIRGAKPAFIGGPEGNLFITVD